MKKAVFCSVLALLQVFICTVGQGALTLCIRKDGTQKLRWSSVGTCQTTPLQTKCPCGCHEDETTSSDELPPALPGASLLVQCSVCTDYLLVAEQPTLTADKQYHQEAMQSFLDTAACCELQVVPLTISLLCKSLEYTSPPAHGAMILSTVVLRC